MRRAYCFQLVSHWVQEAAQQAHALALAEARVGCRWWELLRILHTKEQHCVSGWQSDAEWTAAMEQWRKQRELMLQHGQAASSGAGLAGV